MDACLLRIARQRPSGTPLRDCRCCRAHDAEPPSAARGAIMQEPRRRSHPVFHGRPPTGGVETYCS
ncbi:hypothetical protein ACFFX0_26080 [Citricoccus parietis]|uniref:Uncharacterized protein n=1 Tax=Citricoccus parietis TaxID=592307 RepID=A0ABV5G7S9_9MICC